MIAARPPEAARGKTLSLLFATMLAAAAIPLFSVTLPPLVDYPNHLARMAILADSGRDPILARYYAVHWALLPNLAMDALVPLLARFMPLLLAGRLFLLMTLALLAAGPVLLHRAVWGRWSAWSLLGGLLLYNRVLLWGFVNYLFGLGLGFCALAGWVALAGKPVLRSLLAVPAALVLYLCHIAAFGVCAVILAGIEAPILWAALSRRDWIAAFRRAVLAAVPFLLPAAIFLLDWQGGASGPTVHGHLWRKADLLFSVFDNYQRIFDGICFLVFVALFAVPAIKHRLLLARPLLWALVLLLAVYLALPSEIYSGAAADHRLPLALFMVLIAATRPYGLSMAWRRTLILVPAALFALRIAVVEHVWLRADQIYAADLALLDAVPPGARIAVAAAPDAVAVTPAPTLHLPVLAIARRDAFVTTLFAFPAQQPVRIVAPWDALAAAADPGALWQIGLPGAKPLPSARALLGRFDYVVFVDRKPVVPRQDPALRDLEGAGNFRLYRVVAPVS